MSLSGKVALVTGGAKNLGAEIALELASLGSSLALHYRSSGSQDEAVKLQETIKQLYPDCKVRFYQADLTSADAVERLFNSVVGDFGKIDIVVNTVGKVLKKPIADISEQEYDEMFAYVELHLQPPPSYILFADLL
jgi:NAD(P)-dependent dehydrogenase (short-subunit alcohol dehydrogenase family)